MDEYILILAFFALFVLMCLCVYTCLSKNDVNSNSYNPYSIIFSERATAVYIVIKYIALTGFVIVSRNNAVISALTFCMLSAALIYNIFCHSSYEYIINHQDIDNLFTPFIIIAIAIFIIILMYRIIFENPFFNISFFSLTLIFAVFISSGISLNQSLMFLTVKDDAQNKYEYYKSYYESNNETFREDKTKNKHSYFKDYYESNNKSLIKNEKENQQHILTYTGPKHYIYKIIMISIITGILFFLSGIINFVDNTYPESEYVYATLSGEKYHTTPNCKTLKNSDIIFLIKAKDKSNEIEMCEVCTKNEKEYIDK